MRLKEFEIRQIINTFAATFQHGEIYLFGSRVDDNKKGGDIDLYIIPESCEKIAEKKLNFLVMLKRAIREQKIDVVIDMGKNRLIDKTAKKEGVLLCKK